MVNMIQPYMIKKCILCVTTLQCNVCPTITLTHGPSSYSEIIWTQGYFFKNLSGGGASTKRKMVGGDKKFGVDRMY
jgi:hypothetical protein